jgi:hypothetical protein
MPDSVPLGRLGRHLVTAVVVVAALPALAGCGLFGDDDEGEGVSVFSIEPGQCFEGQDEVKAQLSELTEVDCDEDHAQEAYASLEYVPTDGEAPDTYPGDDALTKFADGACAGAFGEYVGVDYLDSGLFYTFLLPSARSWEDDDRHVICFLTTAGEPLRGSAQGSKR